MLCGECKKKEAVFHSIKITNGVKTEWHLCADCQSKNSAANMQTTAGLLGNAGLFPNFASMFIKPRREIKICSICGMTSADFLESGFLGCDGCYNEFADIVLPVIQKVQNGTSHKGKSPSGNTGTQTPPEDEYECLKRNLDEAVRTENFEEASIIRDRIRIIRGE